MTAELPITPCPLPQDLLDDFPYEPEAVFFDRLLELDPDASRVRARMQPELPLPLTSAQRVHPERHPQHLSGGLLIHATAALAFIHAYFLLGLRHHEGWTGYGTHIHRAVFRQLVPPGTEVIASCRATRIRRGKTQISARYAFEMRTAQGRCYEGDQSGMWLLIDGESSAST